MAEYYSKYSKKKRANKLKWGTCRVTCCSTAIVQKIFGAIKEISGMSDEDKWL